MVNNNFSKYKLVNINNNYIESNDPIYNYLLIDTLITIILGLVIGITIGYIFFSNIKYIGPNSNHICKNIYKEADGREYSLVPQICICPLDYSMKKLHDKDFKEHHD